MRKFQRHDYLNHGDYALITIGVNGEIIDGAIFREKDSTRVFFLSDDSTLNGSRPNNMPNGYSYSWAIDAGSSLTRKLEYIVSCGHRRSVRFELLNIKTPDVVRFPFELWMTAYNAGVNHASRNESMSFISDRYGQGDIYRGQHNYHYHHGVRQNAPIDDDGTYKMGIELEVEFGYNDEAKDAFNSAPSNWFYRERDSSLGDGGVEIITVPLNPSDAKDEAFWEPLTSALSGKAKSWDTGRCGLHVHIGREILGNPRREDTSEVIGKLLFFYHHCLKDTPINTEIYGRSRGYHEANGKTDISNAVELLGKERLLKFDDIKNKVKDSMIDRSREERYFDINLMNSNTIEFRKGRGSLAPKRIVAIVEWSEIIVKYAKSTPWDSISYSDFVKFLKVINIKSELIKEQISNYLQ